MVRVLLFCSAVACLAAADYTTPAGTRPARRSPGAESVLPGGRFLTPTGRQFPTGPGPFGIAVNSAGDIVVTSDGGPIVSR